MEHKDFIANYVEEEFITRDENLSNSEQLNNSELFSLYFGDILFDAPKVSNNEATNSEQNFLPISHISPYSMMNSSPETIDLSQPSLFQSHSPLFPMDTQLQTQLGGINTIPTCEFSDDQLVHKSVENNHNTLSFNDILLPDIPEEVEDKQADNASKPTSLYDTFKQDLDSGEYYEQHPEELKKLTPKQRRQIRNKLSARNFRQRRKEYLGQLEKQVKEYQAEITDLKNDLTEKESENVSLKKEVEDLKKKVHDLEVKLDTQNEFNPFLSLSSEWNSSISVQTVFVPHIRIDLPKLNDSKTLSKIEELPSETPHDNTVLSSMTPSNEQDFLASMKNLFSIFNITAEIVHQHVSQKKDFGRKKCQSRCSRSERTKPVNCSRPCGKLSRTICYLNRTMRSISHTFGSSS